MKSIKDFAQFTVEECGVAFVVCLVAFSLWATSHMLSTANSTGLVALAIVGVILNVLMIAVAVKLAYDDFKDFRARIND